MSNLIKISVLLLVLLSVDDFEIMSKIYSLNCLSCFIHILNYKMSLFFGICFFLYLLLVNSSNFSTRGSGIQRPASRKNILQKAIQTESCDKTVGCE